MRAGVLWFLLVALACAASVGLVGWLAPHVALAPIPAFALAYAAVTGEILSLSYYAPRASPRAIAVAAGLCLLGLLALARAPNTLLSAMLLTLVLGAGASSIGAWVGGRIAKPGQLSAVALVSAIADLWSVFDPSAPSARLAEQVVAHPEQLALFALPYPLLGTALVPAVIGAGDLVFAALYVAAFRAHGLSLRRVLVALGVAFALGLFGLLVTLRPLPLLPLLGLAVLACDPAARSLTRAEWRTVLLLCTGLVTAILVRVLR